MHDVSVTEAEAEEAVREVEEAQTTLKLRSMEMPAAGTQSLAPIAQERSIATIAAPRMDIVHINVQNWTLGR